VRFGETQLVQDMMEEYQWNLDVDLSRSFYSACMYGHLKTIEYLFPFTTHISPRDLLVCACGEGHADVVAFLINNTYIDLDDLHLAICVATRSCKLAVVELLVEYGADVNSALLNAASYGEVELVQWSLQNGANSLDAALWDACGKGHLEVVKCLVHWGADVNANLSTHQEDMWSVSTDPHIRTWALRNNNVDVAKFLLDSGARCLGDDEWFKYPTSHVDAILDKKSNMLKKAKWRKMRNKKKGTWKRKWERYE